MTEKKYSYNAITAITEKLLNKYVEDAIANPETAKQCHDCFNGAFYLWFNITKDETSPDRDADGTRFMDLHLKFPQPPHELIP